MGNDDGDTEVGDAQVGDAFDEARTRGARGRPRAAQGEGARHPRRRRGHRRHRSRARRRHPRALDGAARGARLGVGHLEPFVEARARRHPLPRAARLPARARGAHRTRPAAAADRPAPREARALPVPGAAALLRALLRRRRHDALRHLQLHRRASAGRPAPPAPLEAAGAARHPVALARRTRGRHHLLRRPGRRRPVRRQPRPHGELLRRARREPGEGRGVHQGGRAGRRREGARPADRRALRGAREAGRERDRCLDG